MSYGSPALLLIQCQDVTLLKKNQRSFRKCGIEKICCTVKDNALWDLLS